MPVIQGSVDLAIGETLTNIPAIRDSAFATMPFNARLSFGLVASVTDVFATIQTGSDVVVEDGEISDLNRFPQADDINVFDIAGRGQRLRVGLRNANAAAATVNFIVRIDPIALSGR